MTAPGIRDPDQLQIIRTLRDDLKTLTSTVVGRWGKVPYAATDPTTPANGTVWVRSDTRSLWARIAGTSVLIGAGGGGVIVTDAAQAIVTATLTDITWGTEVSDPDNWTSGGSAVLTCPAGFGGRYAISYTGTWAAVAAGVGITVAIYINGSITYASTDVNLVGVSSVTAVRTLVVGDQVKCVVYHNAGANKDIVSRLEIAAL